jgi:hypothetical protein
MGAYVGADRLSVSQPAETRSAVGLTKPLRVSSTYVGRIGFRGQRACRAHRLRRRCKSGKAQDPQGRAPELDGGI